MIVKVAQRMHGTRYELLSTLFPAGSPCGNVLAL